MMIERNEKYRHFKGNIYEVLNIATHTETGETMVIYKSIDNISYARPYDMFISKVDKEKYPDVKQTFRFEKIK